MQNRHMFVPCLMRLSCGSVWSTHLQPLDAKCFNRSRDILPAPIMHTRTPSKLWEGSLSWASSAAAELTDTAPDDMEVSARTRLPPVMACLKRPLRCRPKPGQSWPTLYTCFTCARICPSPMTSESRPPATLPKTPGVNSRELKCKPAYYVCATACILDDKTACPLAGAEAGKEYEL